MLTPFRSNGSLDEPAVGRLIDHILAGGNQGVLAAGTTGEAVSMPLAMRVRLVEIAVEHSRGKAVVFGGIGDNSIAHSLELAEAFFRAGANAVVVHLPSYYPIDAAGMEYHLRAIADQVSGPLFLYNIPQTTKLSLPFEVIERLSHHPRIAGIKDSEPDGERQEKLARMFKSRADFAVFCGSVPFTSRAMLAGADGYVPGVGNVAPAEVRALMDRCVAGDAAGAAAAQARIDAVSAVYQKGRTVAQSLCAMKAVMELLGIAERHVLPPLQSCSDEEMDVLREGLREAGVEG
ncbi:MAG: dihydrodipicolinate synthase family protein [Opitutaceae bacterium]